MLTGWVVLDFAVVVLSIACWPPILLSRKQPVSMLAWLLGVTFIPVAGPLFFLVFGLERRLPGLPRKKRLADEKLRRQLGSTEAGGEPSDSREARQRECEAGIEGALRVARRVAVHAPRSGNSIRLLDGGGEKFPALLEDIQRASDHINLEYFIFREDEFGRRLAGILEERAAAGVQVRLLLDGVGSRGLSRSFEWRLRDGGVRLEWFHPLNPFARRWSINIRNHRKLAVLDGRVGYLGGINLGDEYLGRDPEVGQWHDLAVRVEGPVVASLQRVFMEDWHFASGEVLKGRRWLPALEGEEPEGAAPGEVSAQLVNSFPSEDLVTEMHQVYFSMLAAARRQAWLMTPYFVPDEAIQIALAGRALAGVDVRLVVPERAPERLMDFASRSFYPQLLEAGARLFCFRPDATLHAKALLIDGELSLVGSANLDNRSFRINFESGLLVHDPGFAGELEGFFERKMALSSERHLKDFARRPWHRKTLEALARLAAPLF